MREDDICILYNLLVMIFPILNSSKLSLMAYHTPRRQIKLIQGVEYVLWFFFSKSLKYILYFILVSVRTGMYAAAFPLVPLDGRSITSSRSDRV